MGRKADFNLSRQDGILPHIAAIVCLLAAPTFAGSCEDLKSLRLPHTTIDSAMLVNGDGAVPAYCLVDATLRPTSDSDIKIEIRMPRDQWNKKYMAVGNGGWSGAISVPAMNDALRRGYATGSTDTGHKGGSAEFALGHPEKLIDYAYRSEHEMTVAAKAIIAAFYGSGAKLSYWSGCSAGGKQALKEAQRYPDDFDGIVAGAPGLDWVARATLSMWVAQAVHKDDASYIPPAKFEVIHQAALRACDAADGLADGVIEDPTRCSFDPKTIECKGPDADTCLTAPQVEAARKIYGGTKTAGGRQVTPGLEPGSELGWKTFASPQPFAIGNDYFKYVLFADPSWNFRTLNFDGDIQRAYKLDGSRINASDPDLGAFRKHGGKLIQYHGWSDPQIPPESSVNYYKDVLRTMGASTPEFYRLFMVPGMAHCGGGEGASSFDMIGALEQWVEAKTPPDAIAAARVRGRVTDRTRPLCPFPQVARYKGSGDPNSAASFTCAAR